MVKNVARVLQVAGRLDVPFYLGADEPLLGDVIDAAYVSHNYTPLALLFTNPALYVVLSLDGYVECMQSYITLT